MRGEHTAPTFHACVLAALACGAALFSRAHPVYGEGGARCLTPDVAHALQSFIATGALERVFPNGLTLQKLDVGGTAIELEVQDDAHHPYGITLALPGSRAGAPDGQGGQFLFYLAASPSPQNRETTKALLTAATLFDQAIPETALRDCSGGPEQGSGSVSGRPEQDRVGRVRALASAVMEVAVLLAAILFGVRAIRSPGGPIDGDG